MQVYWCAKPACSRMYCGIWVDFPLPVAPCMTTTLLCCSACRKGARLSEAGSPDRVARMRASGLLLCHAFQRSCMLANHDQVASIQLHTTGSWVQHANVINTHHDRTFMAACHLLRQAPLQ